MQAPPPSRKLPYLQCLRALAADGVVFLHAQMQAERFSSSAPLISADIAEFGRYGIDPFFVISGFVIYSTNFPQALPARTFFLRRAFRIVPLYWRRDYGELRYVALVPRERNLFFVAFTERAGTMRIISLRKANLREIDRYATEADSTDG